MESDGSANPHASNFTTRNQLLQGPAGDRKFGGSFVCVKEFHRTDSFTASMLNLTDFPILMDGIFPVRAQ
jgi:hypothetical protein